MRNSGPRLRKGALRSFPRGPRRRSKGTALHSFPRERCWPCEEALLALAVSACGPGDARRDEGPELIPEAEGYAAAEDGTRLFYRTFGDGPEAVVIPVGFYLEEALRPLASEERRLVFYDPRGRGRSDAVDSTAISLDHQVADVEAIRRHLGIERMALLGWSGLGMELAVYAIRHPERATRLVQVAPVPPRNTPYNEQAYAERERRLIGEALDQLEGRRRGEFEGDEASFCRALNQLTLPANFADPAAARGVPDVCVYENEWPESLAPLFRALLGSFGDYDWREPLASLEVPRLVIHGEADAFPLKGSEEWVEGYPDARLLVLTEAGHFPFLERPDATFAAVDEFLQGEWPPEAQALK